MVNLWDFLLAIVAYLAVGPLFATPRTATVSFKVGIAPLVGDSDIALLIYSVIYFLIVIGISLYPGKLLDSVGHILAPIKILALAVLGLAALFWPAGTPIPLHRHIKIWHLPKVLLMAILPWIR